MHHIGNFSTIIYYLQINSYICSAPRRFPYSLEWEEAGVIYMKGVY